MKIIPAIFEECEIRRIYGEKSETWFFSVVDIVQVLTQQPDFQTARNYWNKLKERLGKEGCRKFPTLPSLSNEPAKNSKAKQEKQ